MPTRKKYSLQYREEAVELVRANPTKPIRAIAEELGIPQTVLNNWVRRAGAQKTASSSDGQTKPTESQRIKQLERELQRTKEELAFAKKAAAFFARDQK